MVRFAFEVQLAGPQAEAIIQAVGAILAALIGGLFLVWAARIQASHQHPPELSPPPSPKRSRRGRRPSKKTRSP